MTAAAISRAATLLPIVLVPLLGAGAPGAATARMQGLPQDRAVFRTGVKLIVQAVTATGKDGRALEGLSANDFLVVEDGQPQEIAFVEFQRIGTAGISEPSAADTPSPTIIPLAPGQVPAAPLVDARYRNRRLLVLLFDLTAMLRSDQSRAFVAAEAYVSRLMSGSDLIAIMTHDATGVHLNVDFTDDRPRLLGAIRSLSASGDEDVDGLRGLTGFGDGSEFHIFNTDRQLSALQTAVAMVKQAHEQKTIVYFTGGIRLNGRDNYAQLRATTNAAIRAGVTISPIDARGLTAQAPFGDATSRSRDALAMLTGRQTDDMARRFERSQDVLYSLAKDTGGTLLLDQNDLAAGIARAAQSVRSYYLLGFYSTHTSDDGRFRQVRITLRKPLQAELLYRRGYFADKQFAQFTDADKERQLEEAFGLLNPITELEIAVEVNYFRVTRQEYFVPVAVRVPGLLRAGAPGASRRELDFLGEVKDKYGVTVQNVRDRVGVSVGDESDGLRARPLQYETGFALLPGEYSLKCLVRDAATGRIGTYLTSFYIPNLAREENGLAVSSVVLSSQRTAASAAGYNVKGRKSKLRNPLVLDGLKLLPSVSRVFSRQHDLYILLHAYPSGAEVGQLLAYVTLFRDDVKAFETTPLIARELAADYVEAVPLMFTVPLTAVPTGRYDCQISVLEPATQKAAFWRAPILVVR